MRCFSSVEMDNLIQAKMKEKEEEEMELSKEDEELTLIKKREEAERKARRGEMDPTHEYTFTMLAQVRKLFT